MKNTISISDIDINKTAVSNKLPFGKEDFIFHCLQRWWKIRPLCLFFSKVSAYKIDFDETECMYFMIKEEKGFDAYMKIFEKVRNIIKKLIVNLCKVKNI